MRIVFFTGAGISAESGLRTFRDSDGLWEEHRIEDVATPGAWARDPELVLDFYNKRRQQVLAAEPNAAHIAIAALQAYFEVDVVTQNIDDLHERAGSTCVLHLHGEIRKARSAVDERLVTQINGPRLSIGDRCALGSQLRPHIVWFGEPVPMLNEAVAIIAHAEVLVVVGSSLQVYPAAALIHYAPPGCALHLVDPNAERITSPRMRTWSDKAARALPGLAKMLIEEYA